MAMNCRGQMIFYGLMIGITVIILALALAPAVKDFTDSAQNETTNIGGVGLNCTNPDITIYDKGACQITDMTLPYFIGAMIFIGGIAITAKYIFESIQ